MVSRITVAALVCVLIAAVSGCRLIDGRFAGEDRPPRQLSADYLRALRKQLADPNWRANSEWSLIDDTRFPAALRRHRDKPRWQYGNELAVNILDLIDERKQPDSSADYLRELAKEDGLVGWNAAILLAQRDPPFAIQHAELLQEIVEGTRYYDPATGRRGSAPSAKSKDKDTKKPGDEKSNGKSDDVIPKSKLSLDEAVELAGGYEKKKSPDPQSSIWDEFTKEVRHVFGAAEPQSVPGIPVPPMMQSAAAEAWCRALAVDFGETPIRLAPALKLLRRVKLPLNIRVELVRSLAREMPPSRIPNIDMSFPQIGDEVEKPLPLRRAGIEACVIFAREQRLSRNRPSASNNDSNWPAGLADRVYDPDPQLRILYGRWAALADVPDARKILSDQRRDINPAVQEAALISLGVWGGEDARRLLREAADDESPTLRSAAAIGLSRWGAVETVRFLSDSSDRVRIAVTKVLGENQNSDSAMLLERLVQTSGAAVQVHCVRAVKHWPDGRAIPLLLLVMGTGQGETAKVALKDLQLRRKKIGFRFPVMSTEEERKKAVRELARRYDLPQNPPSKTVPELVALSKDERRNLRGTMAGDLKALAEAPLQSRDFREAVARLKRLDRRVLPDLEKLIEKSWRQYPDVLTESILPHLHPAYGHLWKLGDRDPLIRQRAAVGLTAYSEKASLSPLMLAMLQHRITARPDREVWRSAMLAIMPESRPEHRWMVIQASQFPVPEIRQLACDYFGKHPQPDFADRVLELMNDVDNRTVQLAAIRAAGSYHHPGILNGTNQRIPSKVKDEKPAIASKPRLGLLKLMRSADREIADAAAVSLARLGHETGYRELHRMSFDDDARKRAVAYRLMGETGARRFLEHLILRGEKEQTHAGRQAILSALVELTAPDERPVGLSHESGYDKTIQVWLDWLQRRKHNPASKGAVRLSAPSKSDIRR